MKRLLAIHILLFVANITHAVGKNDFAYGYSLEVDGDGAIYTLHLNENIYRGLTRSDRGDLRIFNSQGATVPHYIRRIENRTRETIPDMPVSIFPLYHTLNGSQVNNKFNVHITTDEKGAIIDMNYGKGEISNRILKGYIFDVSKFEHVINELSFNWADGHPDFVAKVNLEGSSDLNTWQYLVSGNVLSNLHYGNHQLMQKKIELPGRGFKYIRMTWQGDNPIKLEKVLAHFPSGYSEEPRQWSKYHLLKRDDLHNYYFFDTKSVLPADRMKVSMLQRNTLVRVTIESARSNEGPWYMRYSGLLYDLQHGDERISLTPVKLPTVTDRFWRIQVLDKEGQLGEQPVLELGWLPEQLLFVAQGESPFTLAYGSATVMRQTAPLQQLLMNEDDLRKQGKLIKSAHLSAVVQLGDKSRLQPPRPPTDWKQYTLWFVLVLGVSLLAFMVFRLYKQMEENTQKD